MIPIPTTIDGKTRHRVKVTGFGNFCRWTRGRLEARTIGLGLPTAEARRIIASAFLAAGPRELPR